MYRGHAASKDLLHQVHLPHVLEPQPEILNARNKKAGLFPAARWHLMTKSCFISPAPSVRRRTRKRIPYIPDHGHVGGRHPFYA
ncbi:MAG: glycoside hydrolase family 32 protein [Ruminococcus sp.]|nr:glycoside hydrolase family 32 protein [Ruminococcus sp.]